LRNFGLNRITKAWQLVFERAAWFLSRVGILTCAPEPPISICLLFDMERLFETYVGVLIRRSWQTTGAQSCAAGAARYLARSTRGVSFEMRPDAAVINDDRGPMRIYDAKWEEIGHRSTRTPVSRAKISIKWRAMRVGYGCRHITLSFRATRTGLARALWRRLTYRFS